MIASCSWVMHLTSLGFGKHIDTVPLENRLKFLRALFTLYFLFDTSIVLPKCSILLFYFRIFGKTSKSFVHALWVVQIGIFAWLFCIWMTTIFLCDPIRKQWIPTVVGHCHSTGSRGLASAASSFSFDMIILLLPLPMLWKLQMKASQKLGVFCIFFCGYSVVVITLGRLITAVRSNTAINEDVTCMYFQIYSSHSRG